MRFFIILIIICLSLSSHFVSALSAVVHVPEKYTDVVPGERLYFEIEIKYPENPERKDLRLNYFLFDVNNNLISESKVLKAIETQASFMDFIVVPETASEGLHSLKIRVEDYENLSEEVETSFLVLSNNNLLLRYLIIVLGLVVLLGILVFVYVFKLKK